MKPLRPDLFCCEVRLTDINDAGQVVGHTYNDTSPDVRAFITGPDGVGTRDLGSLGGQGSHASAINEAGQVVVVPWRSSTVPSMLSSRALMGWE